MEGEHGGTGQDGNAHATGNAGHRQAQSAAPSEPPWNALSSCGHSEKDTRSMVGYLHSLLILLSLTPPAAAEDVQGKVYDAFSVVQHGKPKGDVFVYSAAMATDSDPIVISVQGRDLRPRDKTLRTDLQKNWLSLNVPEQFEFEDRSLASCPLQPGRQTGRCDAYAFRDGDTVRTFYFRVDNWP